MIRSPIWKILLPLVILYIPLGLLRDGLTTWLMAQSFSGIDAQSALSDALAANLFFKPLVLDLIAVGLFILFVGLSRRYSPPLLKSWSKRPYLYATGLALAVTALPLLTALASQDAATLRRVGTFPSGIPGVGLLPVFAFVALGVLEAFRPKLQQSALIITGVVTLTLMTLLEGVKISPIAHWLGGAQLGLQVPLLSWQPLPAEFAYYFPNLVLVLMLLAYLRLGLGATLLYLFAASALGYLSTALTRIAGAYDKLFFFGATFLVLLAYLLLPRMSVAEDKVS